MIGGLLLWVKIFLNSQNPGFINSQGVNLYGACASVLLFLAPGALFVALGDMTRGKPPPTEKADEMDDDPPFRSED